VPVFAAVFGTTLGYWTGNTTGTAQGKAQGKEEAKASAAPRLATAENAVENLVSKIRAGGGSPPGMEAVRFDETLPAPVTFGETEVNNAKEAVVAARSAIEAL
jgi:hypothetical protein